MIATSSPSAAIGRPLTAAERSLPLVHGFIDLSNIWYGLPEAAEEHGERGLPLRRAAENLARGRESGARPRIWRGFFGPVVKGFTSSRWRMPMFLSR